MEVILALTGKARGGVRCHQIEIIEARGTSQMPDNFLSFFAEEIETTADWYTQKATKDTIHFSEGQVEIDGAQFYSAQMKIAFKKDNAELMKKVRLISRLGLMIRWRDNNGTIKLMGTSDNPARFTFLRDNKNSSPQSNVIEGIYKVISRNPVLAYPVAAS